MKLDKLREWIQTLGLVAIPIILGITGNEVAKSNATREVDARMVEIAAQVLAGPASDSTKALRNWAVKELARHSDVPFTAVAESALVRGGHFPGLTMQMSRRRVTYKVCDSTGNNCETFAPLH